MATPPTMERPWTAAETAEDLLAQVEDALVAQWSEEEILAGFDREGLEAPTAAMVLSDIRRDADAAGGPSSSGQHERVAIALAASRRYIRHLDDALRVDPQRCDTLRKALVGAGLREATAQALLSDVTALERRMAAVYHRRMRRLGMQGMVVGGLTTALFAFGGIFGGGGARWHLFTAALTACLFAYSVMLWRRGRPPGR